MNLNDCVDRVVEVESGYLTFRGTLRKFGSYFGIHVIKGSDEMVSVLFEEDQIENIANIEYTGRRKIPAFITIKLK